jgi:hypothetical protein
MSGIGNLLNPATAAATSAAAPAAGELAKGFVASPSGLGVLASEASALGATPPGMFDKTAAWWGGLSTPEKYLYGGAGGLGLMALMNRQNEVPGPEKYDGPLSFFKFDPRKYQSAEIPLRTYEPRLMARGGIADLGAYSDGGRLLKGPGDGMSDNIPATISNKRPARLADGEFVVPADVVSHLGNGSTDAGAKQLYAMMDRVRKARTGRKSQGRQIKPQQYMMA